MDENVSYQNSDLKRSRGCPLPLGATITRRGINFAIFSKHATSVNLLLFLDKGADPSHIIPLDIRFNKTGDIWHIHIEDLESATEYVYQLDNNYIDKEKRHKFNPENLLLDPYAKALSGGDKWGVQQLPDHVFNNGHLRRSLVVMDKFDWEFDQPLNIPLADSIIYEVHVRGFTQHPSSNIKNPGTFAGFVEKIPYLKQLGITAVELLPINEFDETENIRRNPLTGERLLNYWGYNSICFFAPKASYATNNLDGQQINEFKVMVKELHKAGIEVILDIVFNHTAEGGAGGPTFSFRGIDNTIYYILDKETGDYYNFSGCGNTMNCNHPVVRDLIIDCLRYWVVEMHVDGFRFDLASILGRGQDGSVLANPPILERIATDPVLANTKIIAEAWDAAGLYQVGSFPSWQRWAEWNGKFRDDTRRFMRGDSGMVPILATRLAGSSDLYRHSGRTPYHSINYITCHDGFTLADLVSYQNKHNKINGENNRDGMDENFSWNCGMEGTTKSLKINKLRKKHIKNSASLLLLSQGVPMILAGDELGRTQNGNNNAYCQDNDISWINWDMLSENKALFRFFKLLIQFRKMQPSLRRSTFFEDDHSGKIKIEWHGKKISKPDWTGNSKFLAFHLLPFDAKYNSDIYVILNASLRQHVFQLPELSKQRKWYYVADTYRESPKDFLEPGNEELLADQRIYTTPSQTTVILLSK